MAASALRVASALLANSRARVASGAPRELCSAALATTFSSRAFSSSSSSSSSSAPPEGESHADFLPRPRKQAPAGAAAAAAAAAPDSAAVFARIDALVRAHPVVLFMKGSPAAPQCGFSAQAVRLLHAAGADVHGVDILKDEALRAALKEYSKWPTFPQCYAAGEFVGGCDILTGMAKEGELKPVVVKAMAAAKAAGAR